MISQNNYILMELADLSSVKMDIYRPMQINSGGFMLCLEGECEAVIDTKSYHISPSDLIVAFPYSVIQMLSASPNFSCVIIGVAAPFFSDVQIPSKASYFTQIRKHPSIPLTQEDISKIMSLKDMLAQSTPSHPFSDEINDSILKIILYEVATIYSNHKPNIENKQSREEEIFNNFIFQLFSECKSRRQLSYYAQIQLITPSHLSRVVKRISGRGGAEWIAECVVNNIKSDLKRKELSITTICEEYNFANSSFFSQYFKKHVGMTPREYRHSLE